jgi:hypothetical protein
VKESDFEREQIIDASRWNICDKNCNIITLIESDSSYGYVDIHESREDNISEEEQWANINTDRKRSLYIQKDCFEKSQKYCSTGDMTAELYEAYPQNNLCSQILQLQRCGHYGAHACRVCWSFWKARTQFADN